MHVAALSSDINIVFRDTLYTQFSMSSWVSWVTSNNYQSFYPRESFREGLWNHRRTFVCLSVCLFVCYHDN